MNKRGLRLPSVVLSFVLFLVVVGLANGATTNPAKMVLILDASGSMWG